MRKHMLKFVLIFGVGAGVSAVSGPAAADPYACTFNDGFGNLWACNPKNTSGTWECWGGDAFDCGRVGGMVNTVTGACNFNGTPLPCVT